MSAGRPAWMVEPACGADRIRLRVRPLLLQPTRAEVQMSSNSHMSHKLSGFYSDQEGWGKLETKTFVTCIIYIYFKLQVGGWCRGSEPNYAPNGRNAAVSRANGDETGPQWWPAMSSGSIVVTLP